MVTKRKIEIFTASCVLCEQTVEMVQGLACPSCEVVVYDLVRQCGSKECLDKVRDYGISRVPTIVVDGKIAECCTGSRPSIEALKAAGVGSCL
ncbi:MAG TPA: thioredoxin family protein [Candidatus Avalokitesvara rifleensis]|uniref:thioredoxin family protein n=1 Tax=Candidatus Avalokitesvara rifleensis TaxID=3367620 RepID=UPI0027128784|nr:thioredoxin family protein [Candidatus Brocadiales bacterium]